MDLRDDQEYQASKTRTRERQQQTAEIQKQWKDNPVPTDLSERVRAYKERMETAYKAQAQTKAPLVFKNLVIERGTYRHFKGGIYQVVGLAKHSETEELMVLYQSQDGWCWVRPYEMFTGSVMHEGQMVKRFEKI